MEEKIDGRFASADDIREEIRFMLRRAQEGHFVERSLASPLVGALSIATEAIEDWLPDEWPEKALSGMIRAMHGDLTPEEAADLGYPLWKSLSGAVDGPRSRPGRG